MAEITGLPSSCAGVKYKYKALPCDDVEPNNAPTNYLERPLDLCESKTERSLFCSAPFSFSGGVMTLRLDLLATLEAYDNTWDSEATDFPWNPRDERVTRRFISFVSSTPGCFRRSTLEGHLTGSALVVNSSLTKVLLTHHKKLGMWLQLGGHADGNHKMQEVAMTEAHEESGLTNLSFLNYERDIFGAATPVPLPFDLDCHLIPKNAKDPEHYHYDVRYVITAASEVLPIVSEESHDVRWFALDDAREVTQERSMHRQFDKIDWLKSKLRISHPAG